MEKRRILFVDDELNVLYGLQRMLHNMRQAWDMEFTNNPRQALEILASRQFDVVISDMRMPDMNGSRFLSEVMRRHPQIIRIILSGHADPELTMEAFNVTHQLLSKPCDAVTIKATVCRALTLRKLLDGDTPLKALISRLVSLPSLPSLYAQIIEELQSPDVSPHSIARIISHDPAMIAKILQLVNSAYFGLRRRISNLSQAVTLLGLDTIKALVLTVQVFSQFDPDTALGYSVEKLWQHSSMVGGLARYIAKAEGCNEELINDVLMAGLLHDLGKLILAINLPNIYAKVAGMVQDQGISWVEAECRLFGAAHGETGAYLLGLWGLPESIVEAVAYHHHPQDCETPGFSALTIVHIADALSHEFASSPSMPMSGFLDEGYLDSLGIDHRVGYWRKICRKLLVSRTHPLY